MADLSAEGAIASSDTSTSVSTSATPEPAAQAEQVPDYSKSRHKLRDKEIDYQTMQRLAEKGLGADELFRKSAMKEKHWGKIFESLKQGDYSLLEQLVGPEAVMKLAESRVRKEMDWDSMSEEQREIVRERRRAEAAEAKAKSYEEKEEQHKNAVLVAQAAERVDIEMNEAFKSLGVKPTAELIAWAADYKEASMPDDDPDNMGISYADAVKKAVRRFRREAPNIYSSMSPEEQDSYAVSLLEGMPVERLMAVLPRKFRDALRKADLEDVRSQDPHRLKSDTTFRPTAPATGRTQAKKMRATTDDAFKAIEEKLNKKYGGR